jgi:hypothetical protein
MSQPYAIDWVDLNGRDVAKVELPFITRTQLEDAEEFALRAERDFTIISRFVIKFSEKRGVATNICNEAVAQFKLHVNRNAAWIRAFINNVPKILSQPLFDVLYEECIGNLPAQYRGGELLLPYESVEAAKTPRHRPRRDQRQMELKDFNTIGGKLSEYQLHNRIQPPALKNGKDNSKPLVIAVPNPT